MADLFDDLDDAGPGLAFVLLGPGLPLAFETEEVLDLLSSEESFEFVFFRRPTGSSIVRYSMHERRLGARTTWIGFTV